MRIGTNNNITPVQLWYGEHFYIVLRCDVTWPNPHDFKEVTTWCVIRLLHGRGARGTTSGGSLAPSPRPALPPISTAESVTAWGYMISGLGSFGRRSGTSGRYDFNLSCWPKGWGYWYNSNGPSLYPLCTYLIPRYRIDSECLNAENPINYWINVNNARCDKWTNGVRIPYALG